MEKWVGLSSEEARERLFRYGKNDFQRVARLSGIKILLAQFKSPLVYILLAAVLVTVYLGDLVDAGVILAAVTMNTLLGFFQEYKAGKGLEALRKVLAPRAEVYRDGRKQLLDASLIVPGDVVFVSNEHTVAADGVILEEDGIFVEEAVLTGESAPVEKFDYPSVKKELSLTELVKNFEQVEGKYKLFAGTLIKVGVGRMLVVRTGKETVVGKIAKALDGPLVEKTPLQKKMGRLSGQLALIFGGVSFLVVVAGLFRGQGFLTIFPTAVALAVASIPEGLLVSLTMILAVSMQRMLKHKAVVRNLTAAEVLGGVEVICIDKTGTLTEGVMRVTQAIIDLKGEKKDLLKLVEAAILCNDGRDPLEVAMENWALAKLATNQGAEVMARRRGRLDSIPFAHQNKFIATLYEEGKKQLMLISGAPEVILKRSNLAGKKDEYLWLEKFGALASHGYRLVGFGQKYREDGKKIKKEDLTKCEWLGVLVYEDPVRKGVKRALEAIERASVAVKVITGDYKETAQAVLRQVGLVQVDGEGATLTGEVLAQMSEAELAAKIDRVVLFARTTPEQKLKIIEALKKKGLVVAMTGDGVNDAPALKRADVGIVVSRATEVAKETADMVLADDNFGTIERAIEEGRGIYENIRKVITYLLADSFVGVVIIVGAIALGWELPLLAVQILWVNLITDGLPSLALTIDPWQKHILGLKPKEVLRELLDPEVKSLIAVISLGAGAMALTLFWWYRNLLGVSLTEARTLVFGFLGTASLLYVFSTRSLLAPVWRTGLAENYWLWGAVLLGLILQLAAIYVPQVQAIFKTVPLGLSQWGLIVGATLVLMMLIEGVKRYWWRGGRLKYG